MAWRSSGTNNAEMVDKLTSKSNFHCDEPFYLKCWMLLCCVCVWLGIFMSSVISYHDLTSSHKSLVWLCINCTMFSTSLHFTSSSCNSNSHGCFVHLIPIKLHEGFGVITSDHVERAFRRVDRKFFVPRVSRILIIKSHNIFH